MPVIRNRSSVWGVVLLRTPELDAVVQRIEAAGTAVRRLPATPRLRVAITRDPSGNTVEILDGGAGSQPVVAGSKLIIDDRKKAEAFYTGVFGVSPGRRYNSPAFDEVLLGFGGGPFLALFQPLQERPLQRSQYVVTQFTTGDFVAVVERLRAQGAF
jgi:predicted enzyme related to lactoylglutathione lyase